MDGLKKSAIVLTLISGVLAACATKPPPAVPSRPEEGTKVPQQLSFQLASGVYACESGQKVEIRRDERNPRQIAITWQGRPYTLWRHDSTSGLPRYEDRDNGLLWIDLPWKGVLMDANSGRPLANECKAASR